MMEVRNKEDEWGRGRGAYVRLWRTFVHSTVDLDRHPVGP